MNIKRFTIIVPTDYLRDLEQCLQSAGVPGMTVEKAKGFGEHANYFKNDLLRSNVQIEVYLGEGRSKEVCKIIRGFAAESKITAGILIIESVDRLINLNTGQDVLPTDL